MGPLPGARPHRVRALEGRGPARGGQQLRLRGHHRRGGPGAAAGPGRADPRPRGTPRDPRVHPLREERRRPERTGTELPAAAGRPARRPAGRTVLHRQCLPHPPPLPGGGPGHRPRGARRPAGRGRRAEARGPRRHPQDRVHVQRPGRAVHGHGRRALRAVPGLPRPRRPVRPAVRPAPGPLRGRTGARRCRRPGGDRPYRVHPARPVHPGVRARQAVDVLGRAPQRAHRAQHRRGRRRRRGRPVQPAGRRDAGRRPRAADAGGAHAGRHGRGVRVRRGRRAPPRRPPGPVPRGGQRP